MKIIRGFLATWLGWVCLILALRFAFFLSTITIYNDKDFITNSLINKSLETKDQNLNELTVKVLYKLAKIFPDQREKIKHKISKHTKSAKKLKNLLAGIDNDPEIILKESLKELNSFQPRTLINPILFLHLILTFSIATCLPVLGAFFFGTNSIKKIFGRHGPKMLLGLNVLLLFTVAYTWIFYTKLLTQIILFCSSCIITLQLMKSKIITILIGIDNNHVKKIGGILFLVLLLSFFPYFYSYKAKFSEKKLRTAIDKVIKKDKVQAVPLLLKILQHKHKFSKKLTAKIIIAIGKMGNRENIVYLSHLLHEKDKIIQKIALQSIKNILDRDISHKNR